MPNGSREYDLQLSKEYNEDDNNYQTLRQNFPYKPTLFLGLGGTGVLAVSQIKALFLKLFSPRNKRGRDANVPDIPSMYKFLAFDTDEGSCPSNLAKNDEWYHLGLEDLNGFYNGLGKNAFFEQWIVKDFADNSIMNGASGFRGIGRLALTYNISTVHGALSKARDQITTSTVDLQSTNPVIYLIASASGGSGSGMFLDTAFLARSVFENIAGTSVIGIIPVLEGLSELTPEQRKRLMVNTYAAVTELNTFMSMNERNPDINFGNQQDTKAWLDRSNTPWEMKYPLDGIRVKLQQPFDECHIISSQMNDGTRSLKTQGALTAFIARTLFMMTAYMFKVNGAATPDYHGVMVNHGADLQERRGGALLTYQVPGMVQVHFPVNRIANLFTVKSAIGYIAYLTSGDKVKGMEMAEGFARAEAINDQRFMDMVKTTSDGSMFAAETYDENIKDLMKSVKSSYANKDDILSYAKELPDTRAQAITRILGDNVSKIETKYWTRIYEKIKNIMLKPDIRIEGTIAFIDKLKNILETERTKLDVMAERGINNAYNGIERRWSEIRPTVEDVVTDDGIFDMDSIKLPKARPMYLQFLNDAEMIVVDKVVYSLARAAITKLIERLVDYYDKFNTMYRVTLGKSSLNSLQEREKQLTTLLHREAMGEDTSVENIRSHNVMSQEWRTRYFNENTKFRPENIANNLLQQGHHPIEIIDYKHEPKVSLGVGLAQMILDRISPMMDEERSWRPIDILVKTMHVENENPAKVIATLINQMLKPQLRMSGMRNKLGVEPHPIFFCGGIDRALRDNLANTDELRGMDLQISDNMEQNRLNFFSMTLPVAMAGVDVVTNQLEPAYENWLDDLKQERREVVNNAMRNYYSWPKSSVWPRPTKFSRSADSSKQWFAKALALSEMLDVDEKDMEKMKLVAKNPKTLKYALFQYGKAQFWLWPAFEPWGNDAIKGKPVKLGSNVKTSLDRLKKDPDMEAHAKAFVEWFEGNWSQRFNSNEASVLKEKAISAFQERKGKSQDRDQIELWDELIDIVKNWEDIG